MQDHEYDTLSDADLLKLISAGEQRAFDKIYERHWQPMYYYLMKVLGDDGLAQDIIQEIFVSLWERRKELESTASLRSYFLKAAKFKAIDTIRKALSKRSFELRFLQVTDRNQYPASDFQAAKELEIFINRCVSELPPKMRAIYQLSREEKMSYKEIAAELDISEKTVKKQINNALKFFKRRLTIQRFWFF